MACALCQQNKKLCDSHIISELFYKPLYDQKHCFTAVHSDTARITYHQKGFKERLLCAGCEQLLSKHEKYVGNILSNQYPSINKAKVGDTIKFDINYKQSRIFYLSILWRMSISSQKYFKNFSIPSCNEILRQLVLNEDPGNPNEFGCIISAPLVNGIFCQDLFFDPQLLKINGDDVCYVVFGGFSHIFMIPFNHNQNIISQSFIQQNNKWLIFISDAQKEPFVNKRLKAAQKILNKNP